MKKIILLFTILFLSVITTACINNLAVQELNNKAVNYMDKGDSEAAICRLKSSLDLDDEIYQTHYNLAVAYNTIGKFNEAIEELNIVLKLNPKFYDVYYNLGISKESLAFLAVENKTDFTIDELKTFNDNANEAIEAYNKYIENKANDKEKEELSAKIEELNSKIKEYSEIYEQKSLSSSETQS